MVEELNQKISPLIVYGVEIRDPSKAISKRERDAIKKSMNDERKAARERLVKAGLTNLADADEFLDFYWNGIDSRKVEVESMREWLIKNQPLEWWFFARLIEIAGDRALKLGYAKRASNAAKSKNLEPRAWVLIEWARRTDKAQSKSAFARQYAALIKSKFNLMVTPNTIERSWLPKG